MRVLILSGYPELISEYLSCAGYEVKECLSTDMAGRMAKDFMPDAVLVFEDVLEVPPASRWDVLKELAPRRVILMAGKSSPFVPYAAALGVRDFVFLPADPAAILYRLENPASPEEAAEMLQGKSFQSTENQEQTSGKRSTGKSTRSGRPSLLTRLFSRVKSGIIVNGDYVEGDWKTPAEMLDEKCDAVVIPAGWGIKAIREIRRDPRSRAVPVVVIKGNKDYLRAGADICVKKLTPEVIEQATALSRRYRELWSGAETDPLTGLYARRFFEAWLSEQERRPEPLFSVALVDIDHFKSFNDTHGHQAGDAVLAAFGEFLKANTRACDVAARWGGEEFVVGLPDTPVEGAHALIERLRERWVERKVHLPSGESVNCTFSAGVAGYKKGCDAVAEADEMLYKAKESGRNRVESASPPARKVLLLGQKAHSLLSQLREEGIEVTADPADASLVLTDLASAFFAPDDRPLVVIGTGTIADFAVKRSRPDAVVVPEEGALEKVVALALGKTCRYAPVPPEAEAESEAGSAPGPQMAPGAVPAAEETFGKGVFPAGDLKPPDTGREAKLAVLPGGRSGEKGLTLNSGSALYVVCPSRPGLAGEAAARLARDLPGSALVCAAPESTGALALGIPEGDLICSDWRIPGSDAPVGWGGITVWPIDPFKFLNVKDVSAHALVEQIKSKFNLVVVDCAGNLEAASRVPKTDGVIILHKEGDTADAATSYWLKNYARSNVFVMSPSEAPDVLSAENGFIVVKRGISSAGVGK